MAVTAPLQSPIIANNPAFDMFRNAAIPDISLSAIERFSIWVDEKAKTTKEPMACCSMHIKCG